MITVKHLALMTTLLAALPVAAGEYSVVSPGVQIEIAQAPTKFVPFQSEAGNIQGAQVGTLLGFGLVGEVRLGHLFTEGLSGFTLAPSAVWRFGSKTDTQISSNLNFYTSNGSIVSVQNATSVRSTSTKVIALTLPLRWYLTNSAVYGGLFFEAGGAWVRQDQNVDLTVSGLIQAQQSTISESAKISTSQNGYIAGVGYTGIYHASQFTGGLQYQSLKGVGTEGVSGEVRLVLQWTF